MTAFWFILSEPFAFTPPTYEATTNFTEHAVVSFVFSTNPTSKVAFQTQND